MLSVPYAIGYAVGYGIGYAIGYRAGDVELASWLRRRMFHVERLADRYGTNP